MFDRKRRQDDVLHWVPQLLNQADALLGGSDGGMDPEPSAFEHYCEHANIDTDIVQTLLLLKSVELVWDQGSPAATQSTQRERERLQFLDVTHVQGGEGDLIVFRVANDGTYGAKGAAPGRKNSRSESGASGSLALFFSSGILQVTILAEPPPNYRYNQRRAY